MIVRVFLAAGLSVSLSVAACGQASEPPAASPRSPSSGITQDGSAQTGHLDSTAPRTTKAQNRTELSFRDFYAKRLELVGREVVVSGRVLFKLTCPPPGAGSPPPCTATAHLNPPEAR